MIHPGREEVEGLGLGTEVSNEVPDIFFLQAKLLSCEVTYFLCTNGMTATFCSGNMTMTVSTVNWGSSLL